MICDKQRHVYLRRIETFVDRIGGRVLADHVMLDATFRHSKDPVPFAERLQGEYKPAREGDQWGKEWESAWFRLKGAWLSASSRGSGAILWLM